MSPRLARCVAGRGVTLIRRVFEGAPPDCINLGLGQPTDPVPEAARRSAEQALATGMIPYTQTAGLPMLREAIAERAYGWPGGGERILVTAGSQEALWIAFMGLVDPGDDILFAEPGYPAYRMVAEMIGARAVPVPITFEGGWRLSPQAVEDAWTERTRMLVVSSPANPTGMHAGTDDDLRRLYRTCEERDAYLLADEIYAPIRFRTSHRPPAELGDRVIAIHGVSKAFSATGFRVGWLAAAPEIVRALMPLHQQVALAAPTIGQHGALGCLSLWGEPFFSELCGRYAARRRAALEALSELPDVRWLEPDGAFYVMVDVSRHATDTLALAMRLRDEKRVITAPGEAFGPRGAGFLRLSFATDPERIREGIARIGEALAKA